MSKSTSCYAISVISALLMVLTGAIVHLIDWWDLGVKLDLFDQREDTVWRAFEDKRHDLRFYYTQWIFCMWVLMYVTQLCWTIYGIELLARKTKAGNLFHNVPVVPSIVFIMLAIAVAAILVWLYLWTSVDYFRYSPLSMLGATVCCYVALAVSVGALSQHLPILYGVSANRYVWEIRILVHNGLGIAAAWTTVVLFYSVVVVLEEFDILPAGQDGYIYLSLLGGYMIIWFAVDMSLARKYVPHLLTPYFIFIIAEVQVLLKSELQFNYHMIYSAVLLGVTCIMTLVRLSMAVGLANRK